jgi:hypothetical protein
MLADAWIARTTAAEESSTEAVLNKHTTIGSDIRQLLVGKATWLSCKRKMTRHRSMKKWQLFVRNKIFLCNKKDTYTKRQVMIRHMHCISNEIYYAKPRRNQQGKRNYSKMPVGNSDDGMSKSLPNI